MWKLRLRVICPVTGFSKWERRNSDPGKWTPCLCLFFVFQSQSVVKSYWFKVYWETLVLFYVLLPSLWCRPPLSCVWTTKVVSLFVYLVLFLPPLQFLLPKRVILVYLLEKLYPEDNARALIHGLQGPPLPTPWLGLQFHCLLSPTFLCFPGSFQKC